MSGGVFLNIEELKNHIETERKEALKKLENARSKNDTSINYRLNARCKAFSDIFDQIKAKEAEIKHYLDTEEKKLRVNQIKQKTL